VSILQQGFLRLQKCLDSSNSRYFFISMHFLNLVYPLYNYNIIRKKHFNGNFLHSIILGCFNENTFLQVLDCAPTGIDCGKKLLDSIEEYIDKNIVVILLNTDHSMVNCQKNALVYSLREKEEKIIISEHGLDQDSIGLQLVADANSLKQFLQVLLKITLFALLLYHKSF
jgi:hypothetical protein